MRPRFTALSLCTLRVGWDFRDSPVCQGGLIQRRQQQPSGQSPSHLPSCPFGGWVWLQLARQRDPEEEAQGSHLPSPLQILERLNKMCGVGEQMRKKQQRLLKNMDAHKVMLDLLQIPYDKVTGVQPAYAVPVYHCTAALQG